MLHRSSLITGAVGFMIATTSSLAAVCADSLFLSNVRVFDMQTTSSANGNWDSSVVSLQELSKARAIRGLGGSDTLRHLLSLGSNCGNDSLSTVQEMVVVDSAFEDEFSRPLRKLVVGTVSNARKVQRYSNVSVNSIPMAAYWATSDVPALPHWVIGLTKETDALPTAWTLEYTLQSFNSKGSSLSAGSGQWIAPARSLVDGETNSVLALAKVAFDKVGTEYDSVRLIVRKVEWTYGTTRKDYFAPVRPRGARLGCLCRRLSDGRFQISLTKPVEVRIFAPDGRQIRRLVPSTALSWDGRDQLGRIAPRGIYLVHAPGVGNATAAVP